jgi:hypothetical protein
MTICQTCARDLCLNLARGFYSNTYDHITWKRLAGFGAGVRQSGLFAIFSQTTPILVEFVEEKRGSWFLA